MVDIRRVPEDEFYGADKNSAKNIKVRRVPSDQFYSGYTGESVVRPAPAPAPPAGGLGVGGSLLELGKSNIREGARLAQTMAGAGVEMAGNALSQHPVDLAMDAASGLSAMTPLPLDDKAVGLVRENVLGPRLEAGTNHFLGARAASQKVFGPIAEAPILQEDPRIADVEYLGDAPIGAKISKGMSDVGGALPSQAPTIAAGLAFGPTGARIVGSAIEGAANYEQNLKDGLTPEQAFKESAVVAGGVGILSGLPFDDELKKIVPKKLQGKLASFIRSGVLESGSEAAEGGLDPFGQLASGRRKLESMEDIKRFVSDVATGVWEETSVIPATFVTGGIGGAMGEQRVRKIKTIPPELTKEAVRLAAEMEADTGDTASPVDRLEPGPNAPLQEPERFEEDYAPFDLPAQEQAPTAPQEDEEDFEALLASLGKENAVAPSPEAVVAPEPEPELSESEKQAEADLLAEFPELKGMLDAARRSGPLNDDLVNTILSADTVDSREIPKIEVRKPVSKEESLSKLIEERPALDVGRPLDAAVRPEEEGVPQGPARATVRAQDRPRPDEREPVTVPSPEVRATVRGPEPVPIEEPVPVQEAEFVGLQPRPRGQAPIALYNIPTPDGGKTTVTAETAKSQGFSVPEPPAQDPEEQEAPEARSIRDMDSLIDSIAPAGDTFIRNGKNDLRRVIYDSLGISAPATPDLATGTIPEDDMDVRIGEARLSRSKGKNLESPAIMDAITKAIMRKDMDAQGMDAARAFGPDSGLAPAQKDEMYAKAREEARTIVNSLYEGLAGVKQPLSLPTTQSQEPVQAQSPVRATEIAPESEVAQKQPWEMTREEYDSDKPPLKPRQSIVLDNYGKKTEVVQNPTNEDIARLSDAVRKKFPDMPKGEVKLRQTRDEDGNEYVWQAHEGMHGDIEPALQEIVGAALNQNADKKPHRNVVYDALLNGKTIPEEVLSQYPEVVDAYNASKKKQQPAPEAKPEAPKAAAPPRASKAAQKPAKDSKWLGGYKDDESGYVNMALFNPMEALRILRGKLKDGKFIEFEQGFMGLKDLKVARSGKIKSLQMRGKLIAQDFENAWRKEWQKQNPGVKAKTVRFRDMPAETVEALNDYLVEEDAGVKAQLLSELPEGLRRPATQMRDLVDQMSQELIDMGIVEDDVQKVIADQMGFYLRRTYAIFQDPKYRDNIPKAVEDNARQWLREKFPTYTTNQIESALADLKGVGSEKEALNRLVQMGGVLGKLDRRTLGKRNEYDQPILDLWGVDKNGIDNFLNTINALAHMIANFEWLEDIKANGRGSVVLTPQDIAALPQGDERSQWPFLNESDSRKAVSMLTRPKDPAASRNKALDKFIAKAESQGDAGTVEILKKTKALFEKGMKLEDGKEVVDSRNLEGASKYAEQLQAEADKLQAEGVAAPRGKKGPLKAKSRVAQSKANKINRQIKAILEAEEQKANTPPDTFGPFGPLAGARVHPEFKAALQEAVQIQEVAPWIQKWNWFNRQLKQNVTTRDPASALRNFRSGVDFSMANGWMLYDVKNVPKRLTKALSIANVDIRRSHEPELREEYLKMVEYGIAGDTAIVGELNEIQKEAKKAEFLKAAEKALSPELVKAMGGADALATKLYQAGDDVFKIFGALTEQEHLMDATGMDADAALKEAATRVRRQFPTYSEVHKSLQKLRRTPVIGPFVAYQSEVPRNAWNTIAQMATEIKSDNPKVRAMGYRRAAGIMWATANRHAYKAAWLALLGLTPDDDDRIRKALPEYFQGHEFAITEGDKATGKYRGYNLSQADAYGPLKEPFWAALRGENIVDAAAKATEAFGGGYVSPELGTQAIVSVLTGTDARGKDLFLETDSTVEKMGKTLGHVLGQYAVPSPIRRQFKAKSEEEHALEVFGTLTGYRFIDIDLPTDLFWKAKDFKKYGTEQVRDAYTAARDGDTEAARKQLTDLEAVRKDYFDELQEAYIAFRDTGLNQETMDAKLKEAGLSGKEIEAVKYGTLEPYTPPQKLTDMME